MPFRFMPEEFEEDVYEPKAVAPVFAPPEPPAPPLPPGIIDEEPNPYREIARPMMDELMAARKRAQTLQSGAMISRGGDRIASAIGGIKPDYSAAESLESQAKQELDNPIREMQATGKLAQIDAKFQDLARKARDAREAQDPLSDSSKRAQDFVLASGVGKHLGEDVVRRMSVEDLKRSTPVLRMAIEADQDGWRRNRLENKDAYDREHDSAVLDDRRRRTAAMAARGAEGGMQDRIDQRALDRFLVDLGKVTTRDHSAVVQGLKNIERLLPGMTSGQIDPRKISSADRALLLAPGGLGERFVDPNAVAIQTALQDFQDLTQRDRSGAVLNEGEVKHYDRLFRNQVFSDPQNAANTLRQMKAAVHRKLRDLQAGFPLSVLEEYRRRHGTSYTDPIFAEFNDDLPPAPKPQVPTATPVREPAATPSNYTRGGKVMLINRATGQAMWASPEVATKALASGKYREVKNDQEYQALGGAQ